MITLFLFDFTSFREAPKIILNDSAIKRGGVAIKKQRTLLVFFIYFMENFRLPLSSREGGGRRVLLSLRLRNVFLWFPLDYLNCHLCPLYSVLLTKKKFAI